MILAGDIGGTNTRLAIADRDSQGRIRIIREDTFPSREHPALHLICQEFLQRGSERAEAACFGVAGPVHENRCVATNLEWVVDGPQLVQELQIPRVRVLNDLEANAYGIACLEAKDIDVVRVGQADVAGHAVVISPGTGLGQAGMFWDGRRYTPVPTEGGHTDFGPQTPLQFELAQYLIERHGRVSWERVVSGPGLLNIYRFLRDTGRGEQPVGFDSISEVHLPRAISEAALQGRSALCEMALDLFLELMGAEAGNMALKYFARSGIWLGGGIVVKLRERLKGTPHFVRGLLNKGRMREEIEKMPVRILINDKTALLGAASQAFELRDSG